MAPFCMSINSCPIMIEIEFTKGNFLVGQFNQNLKKTIEVMAENVMKEVMDVNPGLLPDITGTVEDNGPVCSFGIIFGSPINDEVRYFLVIYLLTKYITLPGIHEELAHQTHNNKTWNTAISAPPQDFIWRTTYNLKAHKSRIAGG